MTLVENLALLVLTNVRVAQLTLQYRAIDSERDGITWIERAAPSHVVDALVYQVAIALLRLDDMDLKVAIAHPSQVVQETTKSWLNGDGLEGSIGNRLVPLPVR